MTILAILVLIVVIAVYLAYPFRFAPARASSQKIGTGLEEQDGLDMDELAIDRASGRLDDDDFAVLQSHSRPGKAVREVTIDDDIEERVRALRRQRQAARNQKGQERRP